MRKRITALLGAAATVAALAVPGVAQAAAAVHITPATCTEKMSFQTSSDHNYMTIWIVENTCDEWIRARVVCGMPDPYPDTYGYGPWVNGYSGESSVAYNGCFSNINPPYNDGLPDKSGFVYSKTGTNDINCWFPPARTANSGTCSN